MKQVHICLDSALRDIFAFEEAKAVFDKFLPGMRAMVENQPAACGFSARKLIGYSGGAVPAEVAGALDAALSALEVYSDEPDIADTPLTADGAEVAKEPPHDAIYPGKVWRDTSGRRIQAHGGSLFFEDGVYYWYEVTSKNWLDDYDREYADTYEAYRQMVEEKIAPIKNPIEQIPAAHSYKYRYPSGRLVNEADVAASGTVTPAEVRRAAARVLTLIEKSLTAKL